MGGIGLTLILFIHWTQPGDVDQSAPRPEPTTKGGTPMQHLITDRRSGARPSRGGALRGI
jgi:hypothetical protein